MKLLEVELAGFKSFAARTTFQFRDGLTAIIGPNGSGKSNFTEAVRWVLGEQSLKQLRGQESTDVIFAGNPGSRQRGYAKVLLTLSNEEGRLPVPAAEVVLGRTLNRSGESEYTLNGDLVRLQDVQQLLADAGLGTKSYTVISQGTVDRYLTATPAGRRELFDEATGVKSLQLKLQRAQRTLLVVTRKAQELATISQELAPRLRVLKRQARQYAERGQLISAHQQATATFFHQEWQRQSRALQQATAALESARRERSQARGSREAADQRLRQLLTHQSSETDTTLPQTQAIAQLRQAEAAYEAEQVNWQNEQRRREELQQSLAGIHQARQAAERALEQARRHLAPASTLALYQSVLTRCQSVITQLQAGNTPPPTELERLAGDVAQALRSTTDEAAQLQEAHFLVERIAGPLQAVARAEALEQDRRLQLENLPPVLPPSDAAVRAAQARVHEIETTQSATPEAPLPSAEEAVNVAREAELEAERAVSAAETLVAQAQRALGDLEEEMRRACGSGQLALMQTTPPPATPTPTRGEIERLAGRITQLETIDPLAVKEYEEVAERQTRLQTQLQDVSETLRSTETLIRSLRGQMHHQFHQQFEVIQVAFKEYFHRLFGGGAARLQLVTTPAPSAPEGAGEESDLAIPGVEILVHPPGKQLQHVQLLSGGEKALTSLALLFAILRVQQPPFLILDEVDAALDEANSHRFSELLREKSQTTQCIVVSHNRETMSHADALYGITMHQDGISRVYSINLADVATTQAAEIAV